MKKNDRPVLLTVLLALMLIIAVLIAAVALFEAHFSSFTKAAKETVRVVTKSRKKEDEGKVSEYWSVSETGDESVLSERPSGKKKKISEFEPEITEYVDHQESFYFGISTQVKNEKAESLKMEDSLYRACKCARESIDHEIFRVRAFQSGDNWYLFADLNVNWFDPCQLYRYNINTGKLTYLAQWDDAEVLGISVP
ncbi:MAG: hypothetical protein K6E19_03220 [Lachnospiraceae bacterium]|nr:hypothetical protein [Lachnospiraceae bacterium]